MGVAALLTFFLAALGAAVETALGAALAALGAGLAAGVFLFGISSLLHCYGPKMVVPPGTTDTARYSYCCSSNPTNNTQSAYQMDQKNPGPTRFFFPAAEMLAAREVVIRRPVLGN